MKFSVLGSSSKGNCTFVEHIDGCGGRTRILIDCGHSARQIQRKLDQFGVPAETIDAILITHEHNDHIQGLRVFAAKSGAVVHASRRTRKELYGIRGAETFEVGESFGIGSLTVHSFRIQHDAVDPSGFVIEGGAYRLGVATDLGEITTEVDQALTELDALILEANYDTELLATCGYPYYLQQRISSSHGHLQNEAAVEFLKPRICKRLRNVVMAHISEHSNTPVHVQNALSRGLGACDPLLHPLVRCAHPSAPTPLISLTLNSDPCSEAA